MPSSGDKMLELCTHSYHSPWVFAQLLCPEPTCVWQGLCCSRTCSLGQGVLVDGADSMFLFQVEATLLKMHDSWNNLPSPPSYLILGCSSPPAHKAFQYLVVLPFALASAHPPRLPGEMCRGLAKIRILPSVPSTQQMDMLNKGP